MFQLSTKSDFEDSSLFCTVRMQYHKIRILSTVPIFEIAATSVCTVMVPFHWGAYFFLGAYERDVVVVIKTGAHIHGVLVLCGCLLSRFYFIYNSIVLFN